MTFLINNINASERCLEVFNKTRIAIGDHNLKSQTPAAVSLLKSDHSIMICIELHPTSKTFLEWVVGVEPGTLENLIQNIRGKLEFF